MLLPDNFTGYDNSDFDEKPFKTMCFSLQNYGYKIVEVQSYKYPRNYLMATIKNHLETLNIYMNCYCPVIAISMKHDREIEFIDNVKLNDLIHSIMPEYTILSLNDLSCEIREIHKANLSEIELKALKHWAPLSIGQALFSECFD